MTLITGQVADVGMNNASGVFYARAAEFRGDGTTVVSPSPATFTITGGVVSAEVAPGPTIITLHVGPIRKDWFVNVPETDVGLGDLIATYTTYEPAVVSAAIKARDAAIEAESEAKQAAIDAEAKRVAAEAAADLTGQDRLHVDNVRALLDETYDQSQAGMALPPRLMESELNATYDAKGAAAQVESTLGAAKVDKAASDALLTESAALTLAGQRAMSKAVPVVHSSLDEIATPTPDGRTTTYILNPDVGVNWGANATDAPNRYKTGTNSKRLNLASGDQNIVIDPPMPAPATDPLTFPPSSIVRAWVWVDEPEKITYIGFRIHTTSALTTYWDRNSQQSPRPLVRGWNLLSWVASASGLTGWGNAYRVTIYTRTTAATAINLDSLWVESPPKGQMIFVEDRGYKTFVEQGLPDLRARKLPVTWALDPALLGSNPGTRAEAITEAQVQQFYDEGDDITIHSWDGTSTNDKTDDEVRLDSLRALRWITDRHLGDGHLYRPSFVHNAPGARASRPYFAAYATTTMQNGPSAWPLIDRWNVQRRILHSATPELLDTMFANLQATNELLIIYTHGIHPDGNTGGADTTPAIWSNFLAKVDEGIAGGWLEGVTFTELLRRSGGVLRTY